MRHTNISVPLYAVLLALLPLANAGQNVQISYFLHADFTCKNGITKPGYSVYVVGSLPEIGNWAPAKAVLLTPSNYPTWTGLVGFSNVKLNEKVEWKCIIRNENNASDVQKWQPDPNNEAILIFSPTVQTTGTV
ncbi:carbohydrate-binding module family 20 domain-containing protein [Pseudomonas marginalis]|uniref:Carbohydrate-binding protein n=1 Tax=Pseudomonas marginalis TaxID=298 RepID=A0A9X5QH07_PSEMA|nr:carbohydrate-binding module family 20 domain-containing protein [Pseudomonas marginalis]OAJ45820.1 carbohydrate-binding protein [Pseudomonas marginalis]